MTKNDKKKFKKYDNKKQKSNKKLPFVDCKAVAWKEKFISRCRL